MKFEYTKEILDSFEFDEKELLDIIVNDLKEDEENPDYEVTLLDVEILFGDNILYYLNKIGFPEDQELDHYTIDFIYDKFIEAVKAMERIS